MLRLGLKLTVSLAAILAFLALASGHQASAAVDLTGNWMNVYSQPGYNVGDCNLSLLQDLPDHYVSGPIPGSCERNGATTVSGGSLNATLVGLTLTGSVTFASPPGTVVTFVANISADGNSSSGTWAQVSTPFSGTFEGGRQQDLGSSPPDQTASYPGEGNGASITFAGSNPGGSTGIVSATTADASLPGGFQLIGQYYHVLTTAPHGPPGPYIFCAGYLDATNDGFEDTTGAPEVTLQIAHYEPPSWVMQPQYFGTPPQTTDTTANTVCASVTHLSQFALVQDITAITNTPTEVPTPEPTPTPTPTGVPTPEPTPTPSPTGATTSVPTTTAPTPTPTVTPTATPATSTATATATAAPTVAPTGGGPTGPQPVGGFVDIVAGDSSSGSNVWIWTAAMTAAIALLMTGGWVTLGRRR